MLRARYSFATVLFFIASQLPGQSLLPIEKELLRRVIAPFNAPDSAALPSALIQVAGDKSVVAIGEVTHGTKEIEQLQLVIAKTLVRDRGFRAVALGELYISNTWLLNEYVLSGGNSTQKALQATFSQQYGGVTSDMLRFVEWLRAFNASRPLDQRVWLMGTECGPPGQLARIAWMYSQKQSIPLPDSLQKTLVELLALPDAYEARPDLNRLLVATQVLVDFVLRSDTAASFTPKQHWQRQCIRQLPEAFQTFCRPTQTHRDRAIYENIRWLKEYRPNTKIVVIAIHNAHIEKRPCYDWPGLIRAGYWLDSAYRKQFVAIGTEVGRGTYASGNRKETRVVRVPESRQKVGTLINSITNSPYGFVWLNESLAVTQFFRAHNRLTYGTSDQRTGMVWPCANLPEAFDALLYCRESTPTQRDSPHTPAFSLYVTMTDSIKRQLQRRGQVRVSLQADFSAIANTDCFVRLTVYCHTKRKKQLQYHLIPLSSGTLVEQLFHLPPETHFISVTLYADQVATLTLKRFELDGRPVPWSTFSFHDWESANAKKQGTHHVLYLPEQIIVRRQ